MNNTLAWIAASRLRTLPLSISGIIVGSSLATPTFWKTSVFWLAIVTTVGFQVVSNFANDYGDGVKGSDTNRTGEKRMVASGIITAQKMKRAVIITSIITFLIALLLLYIAFGNQHLGKLLLFIVLGLFAIGAAIKYTVGINAYGYSGYGDVFVFIFFGLVSVLGSFYLFVKEFNWIIILPAIAIGCLSIAVLNLNNMRDIESDKAHNKNTIVVKIGSKNAKVYQSLLILIALVSLISYTFLTYRTNLQFLFIIGFLPIFNSLATVWKNKKPILLDSELKKVALSTFLIAIIFAFMH